MTDDELKDLSRELAEEVMGWHSSSSGAYWEEAVMPIGAWDPPHNIAQAMMVAEKISADCFFSLERYSNFDSHSDMPLGMVWRAWFGSIKNYKESKSNPALAISLAAREWLRAKKER